MTPIGPDQNGLRTVYQLGGDWLWFFLAVLVGLLLAGWLGGLAIEAIDMTPGARS